MGYGYGKGYGYSYGLADPTSLLIPADQILPLQGLSSNVGGSPLPLGSRGLTESGKLETGPLSKEVAVSPSTAYDGFRVAGFFEDFYERIYVTPDTVDFGLFIEPQSAAVSVWNAYFSSVTLESVDTITVVEDGVTVTHPALPFTIAALGTTAMTVAALSEGPLRIDGTISLVFSDTSETTIPVTGVRARLWPFNPNWSSPWTETLEYRTETFQSRAGREQRSAMRSVPRKRIEYTSLVYNEKRRKFDRALDSAQQIEHAIPDLPRRVATTAPVVDRSVTVASIPDWLAADMLVALTHNRESVLKYVEDITGTTITFNDTDEFEWPTGSLLHPVILGYLDTTIPTRRLTDSVAEASIRFASSPGRHEYEAPLASPFTFNGRDLFVMKPDYSETPTLDFERQTETVDYGSGVVARHNPIVFGTRLRRLLFTNRGIAEADTLRSLFMRCRGRRGEFYMPTGEADMVASRPVVSGTSALRLKGTEIYDDYATSTVFKAIYLTRKNGASYARRIVSMYLVDDEYGNDTMLQLASGWSTNIPVEDISMISWLPCYGFASDSLTIEWLTDSKSRSQVTLRTLEDLPAE